MRYNKLSISIFENLEGKMVNPKKRKSLKEVFTPITLITSLILLVGFVLMTFAFIFLGRSPSQPGDLSVNLMKVSAPTLTQPPPTPTIVSSPTPTSIFFLPDGVVGVGAYVQVSGTGGAGLRMRAEPGLDSSINFTALDSEVFLVIDGPIDADGYTWWHLEAPYDKTRTGWSAGEFLTAIQEEGE
jgi:hypothetical protein